MSWIIIVEEGGQLFNWTPSTLTPSRRSNPLDRSRCHNKIKVISYSSSESLLPYTERYELIHFWKAVKTSSPAERRNLLSPVLFKSPETAVKLEKIVLKKQGLFIWPSGNQNEGLKIILYFSTTAQHNVGQFMSFSSAFWLKYEDRLPVKILNVKGFFWISLHESKS